MKAYVMTSGVVFGLITLAHVGRVMAEGWLPAANPWFIATSVLSVVLTGWSWRVWRKLARP